MNNSIPLILALLVLGLICGSEFNVAAFGHPVLNRQPLETHIRIRSSMAALFGRVMPFWMVGSTGSVWIGSTDTFSASSIGRVKRSGAAACSSCTVDAGTCEGSACSGMGSLSPSRSCLVNTKRRSTSWHSEHMKVWCSKPGTAIVSSWTTFVRIISAPHAIQRIAALRLELPYRALIHQYRRWPPSRRGKPLRFAINACSGLPGMGTEREGAPHTLRHSRTLCLLWR